MRTPQMKLDPERRIRSFDEVVLGYAEEEAVNEASRCIFCSSPKCVEGCPVKIDIPGFIKLIKERRFDAAISKIKEANNLPGICGRVCPQEKHCEKECVLCNKGDAVAIGHLERFAADNGKIISPKIGKNRKKVAVVGSGPAGLTCAADLALLGYKATILEALHKPGGVLRYGIPEFRLPNDIIDKEIDQIKDLGVEIKTNTVIGRSVTFKELDREYDAVFIGAGAGLPLFMEIEGEHLVGVYSANEFLTRVNLMNAHLFPKHATPLRKPEKTVVVGGGNTAMDAARVARRLGSEVTIVYRRSIEDMPARIEDVTHAQEEDIKFLTLTNPSRILGKGKVEGIECLQMMHGEPDETGRRSPVPIESSEFAIECDTVIIAIGQAPNPIIAKTSTILSNPDNSIIADAKMRTSVKGIFAGGDITIGSATVIKAMGEGRKAAASIHEYLSGRLDEETINDEEN